METDSVSVDSTRADDEEISVTENSLALRSPASQRTSEERTNKHVDKRNFKKSNTYNTSAAGRPPMQNCGSRGNRMRQYHSREVIANRGRCAQVSPPYMGRFHGMANS
ncbi:hypothetical protein KIN20_013229 [Parelaphostrongylus tenuis]|uniref:Uncharacterized protein n=1 Tax=Parelaphostrongylus tenuis TaxID=148309 RepID=A0AAD5QQV5_PARTN|nr:hypothetical protein KIN20_013229 [Parelaphostrongylus tenuis]